MLVVGIDNDTLKHDFGVGHKDFQGVHTCFFHVEFYSKPTLVVEYFGAARLSFAVRQ